VGRKRLIAIGRVAMVILIAAVLQTLVASQVTILGISIDLFLVFTVMAAIAWGPLGGAVFGFAAGVAADISYNSPLGTRSLVYVLVGYSVGLLVGRLGTRRLWYVMAYTAGASFLGQVVFGVFAYVMGPRGGFFTMLGRQMIPGAALDALASVPIYLLLVKARVLTIRRLRSKTSVSATH
jgi:rod shape-determining protein MreD